MMSFYLLSVLIAGVLLIVASAEENSNKNNLRGGGTTGVVQSNTVGIEHSNIGGPVHMKLFNDYVKDIVSSFSPTVLPTETPTVLPTETPTFNWTQTGDLGNWTPGSQGFACALSYDGLTVVTNAWQNTNAAGYLAGATRIYNQNISSQKWVQIGQEILGTGFLSLQGWPSISGDGKTFAVGEGYANGGNGAQSGLIQVFTFLERTNEWVQVGNNIAGEAAGNQLWWSALNFDGNILAAGALLADNNGTDSGNLRLFQLNSTTNDWVQLGRTLTGNAGQQVGFPSISMTGKVVALGSALCILYFNLCSEEDQFNGIGGVQVYHWAADDTGAENWQKQGQFLATIGPDGYPSLSADGKIVAVGSRWADAENITDRGQVQVYRLDDVTNLWVQYGQTVYGEEAGDNAGNVKLSGDGKRFILGGKDNEGPPNGTKHGHVRVFEIKYNPSNGTLWEMLGQEIFGVDEGDELDFPSINYDGAVIAAGAAFGRRWRGGHVRTFRLDQFP